MRRRVPPQWKQEQLELAKKVVLKDRFKSIRHIVGLDLGYKGEEVTCAAAVFDHGTKDFIEGIVVRTRVDVPYIPTYLSYRELPAIQKVMETVDYPDLLLMFDGNGVLHPRRIGIASHLGLFLEKPSIGSAKSHLYGKYDPAGRNKGDFSLMKDDDGSVLGAVVTTRDGTNPVFVSPGHLADIRSSVELILNCSPRYKIPEPIRAAHRAASLVKA